MFFLVVSFIAGALTILAPCILPLLPIIVGRSLEDGKLDKKKTFVVIASLGVSVMVFTLLLKATTVFITIPEYTWKLVSGSIVLFFGLITLFPSLWESSFVARMSARANMLLGRGEQKKSVGGDILVGAALGPVFSTCSPTYLIVLATVLPANPALGVIYLLSFILGLSLALLVVALLGERIIARLGIAADPRSTFKKVLGIIFILVGIAILSGFDKKLETAIVNTGFLDITRVENIFLRNLDR